MVRLIGFLHVRDPQGLVGSISFSPHTVSFFPSLKTPIPSPLFLLPTLLPTHLPLYVPHLQLSAGSSSARVAGWEHI